MKNKTTDTIGTYGKDFKEGNPNNLKRCQKMLFPFKNKDSEKSFGFVFSIFGIVVMMLGFSNPNSYFIDNFLSTSLTGLIIFFIGLFYFVDSMP